MLASHKINKHFGSFQVLKEVDFRVDAGEAVGVVGPNGAGKTTLFGILAGALTPSTGEVSFLDRDVTALDAAERCRAGIARTHQVPRPFLDMTVFENVSVAASHGSGETGARASEFAVEALLTAGLIDHANRAATTLGLLDRKRLELARALATRPKVLLLDEIGGGLTERELEQLVALVLDLKRSGMTIVWIEHILHALLDVIDRLVCMNAGSVIAQGDPGAVMSDPIVRRAYLGAGTA
ncbi:ATP-binding cassette domain-containing protein [Bradyrhizobium manausense]|uniref:ABC transporter ATP-binding protein n=1 Tax=Bradyrhizobium manausense TaxID=989370 RepID=UPI001BADA4AF|nr:ATP-binding cassette domain-containing protein [Bradyrhizobium manausense]MBR0687801.1 ATP-binding cassette domain-containing protein [Bradyrhizobium manausense]